jgi:DNA topoisomerase-1
MTLVIVESPAKARTLQKILGPGYVVRASLGHVRDLPPRKFGIDVENGFEPTYTVLTKRKPILKELKRLADAAYHVVLATDPDREGEAISWHLAQALKLPAGAARRVTFHEITPDGIRAAFERPGDLSTDRVHAQQARRLVDRIVGYKLSPLLWRKIAKRLSAGRVQSVALKFVVDREREIAAFRKQEYWTVTARLSKGGKAFEAKLAKLDGLEAKLGTEAEARAVVDELRAARFEVASFDETETRDRPFPPFTTSLLQQRAAIELGLAAKRTMQLAQQLYEGIDLGARGTTGLITYMRTDSMRVAGSALHAARLHIEETFGAKYVPESPNFFKSRAPGAQEAHEAIRPARLDLPPEAVRKHLTPEQFRLYRLIWDRFIASQMAPAVYLARRAELRAGRATFEARGRRLLFDGHLRVTGASKAAEQELPDLAPGDSVDLRSLEPKQHFTEPPPPYTEASLIKTLEKHGIGRPSTYAPTLATLTERGYVRVLARKLKATDLGVVVIEKLEKHFDRFLHAGFTAEIEALLDRIEEGAVGWSGVVREFYEGFLPELERAEREMTPATGPAGEACPKCGGPMSARFSRFGRIVECACGFKKPPQADFVPGQTCDRCGAAMAIKWSARGRFLSCSRYPECAFSRSILRGDKTVRAPAGFDEKCPRCGKALALKGSFRGPFLGCSGYPACRFAKKVPRDWKVPLYPRSRTSPAELTPEEVEEKE